MKGIINRDRVRNTTRRESGVKGVVEVVASLKWTWAGHAVRIDSIGWAKITEWCPRSSERSWRDGLKTLAGTTWIRTAQDRENWSTLLGAYVRK